MQDGRFTLMRAEPPTYTEVPQPFSHRPSDYSPASKLDARKDTERGRLNGRRVSINPVGARSVETAVGSCCVLRSSVTANSSGIVKSPLPPLTAPSLRKLGTPRDVRASKGPRSRRHSKGEPPLKERGLPLAMTSLLGGRVPLRPREAVEHPDTSGTIRDVGAPRGHDRPPRFEEV